MNIITTLLLYIISFFLASIAAYFSIQGLTTIFTGNYWLIVLMGIGIESSKLAMLSWLFHNWKLSGWLLKLSGLFVAIVAIILTSVGIYGFLAKSHLEHGAPTLNMQTNIAALDAKILKLEDKRKKDEVALNQLDETIAQLLQNQKVSGKNGVRAVREAQRNDREMLSMSIDTIDKELDEIRSKKTEIQLQLNASTTDIGVLKYIAETLSSSGTKVDNDSAVRIMIVMVMVAFDPMAIILLMCANFSYLKHRQHPEPECKATDDSGEEEVNEGMLDLPDLEQEVDTPIITSANDISDQEVEIEEQTDSVDDGDVISTEYFKVDGTIQYEDLELDEDVVEPTTLPDDNEMDYDVRTEVYTPRSRLTFNGIQKIKSTILGGKP